MNALFVIPARGGSKEVPGKNLKLFNGRPLIHYTLDVAAAVAGKADICVSTDSPEIAAAVREYGFDISFMRPAELATDTAGNYEVLLHAHRFFKQKGAHYDVVVMLQPTSPFRTPDHVREAMELYDPSIDMIVSVKETEANPYFLLYEEDENGFLRKSKSGDFSARQQSPTVWEYNGVVYVINAASLEQQSHLRFDRVRKYVMDRQHSLDLDTQLDWDFAEFVLQRGLR